MAKTLAFGGLHLATSFSVAYIITGSVALSGAVTFVEPAVNTVVHYFFDKFWERRKTLRPRGAAPAQAPTSPA
ncbi:hypothetical protein CDO44_02865 [Pigmentiphaga sp. NML080357]|uniref:DUF2061 domain-containing protein n=1 Tax=Pigmentiphaga sp. NML080357 TaxID=2008675 RepID=UPI000B422185|nr:DUF2061 domain-containing protein [Pigmentiphaga sp. NML080357]OVZ64323.1 hypothetical protein CDO44_02865 [Pigmentiphaga sp. NML080357]